VSGFIPARLPMFSKVVQTPPFIYAYDRFCALRTEKVSGKFLGESESKFVAVKSSRKIPAGGVWN